MGTMLLLAAAGAQPNKPFFSQQVILASMHQLIGADAFEERQQNPWDQVGLCDEAAYASRDVYLRHLALCALIDAAYVVHARCCRCDQISWRADADPRCSGAAAADHPRPPAAGPVRPPPPGSSTSSAAALCCATDCSGTCCCECSAHVLARSARLPELRPGWKFADLQAAMVPLKALLQLLGHRVLAAPTFRYCIHILLQLLRAGCAPHSSRPHQSHALLVNS